MSLVSRIKDLAQARKISLAELERATGISNGQIRKWDSSKPGIEKLQSVADYFGVSTDYLLERTDNPYGGLSTEQRKLTIEEAIDSVMSHDGKEVTENDREILKRIAEAYLDGKL